MNGSLTIVDPGISTTVQDRGRPGFAHLGVSRSGAVDPGLAALVNRLVGNPPESALIETCGGLVVRADSPVTIASSTELAPVSLRPGDRHRLAASGDRLWHYLAVRGGIESPAVLGSRATDTLAGLGGADLAAGVALPVGVEPPTAITTDLAPLAAPTGVARITPGPRRDWFDDDSLEVLCAAALTVTASSRIGVRLNGATLRRTALAELAELASEGLVRGAIQVPPDGDPVMMLADHPTTGGYPVLAIVHPDDVATVAQTPPGGRVRLTPVR